MPAYQYHAFDAQGRSTQGVLEADNPRAARAWLRQRGWIPVQVEAAHPETPHAPQLPWWRRDLWPRRVLPPAALLVWTRQMAGLVSAGLPLERALSALFDDTQARATQAMWAHLRAEVQAGHPLAKALGHYPREFGASYQAVIAAGEQGGDLGTVLTRLANDLEERETLRQKVLAAALYPSLVSFFALAMVVFLMTYVVPQVTQVFSGRQQALPWLTQSLLVLSQAIRTHGGSGLALLAGTGLGLWSLRQHPVWRPRWDALCLRLPLFGPLAQGHHASRFAATLALLVHAGIPILKALQTANAGLSNQAMRQDAEAVLGLVREGVALSSALSRFPRFPKWLVLFSRLGEETGQLPLMLERAGQQLGAEVQRRALRLATLLEPLLIVGMGGVVMLIVLAVLLPIMQLNQLVQ